MHTSLGTELYCQALKCVGEAEALLTGIILTHSLHMLS